MKQSKKLLLPVTILLTFFLGFEAGGFQLVLLKVAQEFCLDSAQMGGLVTAQFAAIVIFPLLFGHFSDRVGKKKVLLLFTGVFVAGCLIVSVGSFVWVFVVGIFILGAGYSMCEGTTAAALADAYPDRSGKYINLVQCFFCLGAISGPLVGDRAIVYPGLDWRVVFLVCAVAFAAVFALLLFTRFETTLVHSDTSECQPMDVPKQGRQKQSSYKILICPAFGILLFSIILYISLENGLGYFLDSLFQKGLSAPELSAAAIALFWLSMMFSRLLAGVFHRYQQWISVISFFGTAGSAIAIAYTENPVFSLVCCFLLGFMLGPIWPIIMSLATQEFPENTGMATGVLLAGCGLGGAFSPVLMGYWADAFDIHVSFALLAVVAVCGAGMMFYYSRKKKE